MRDNYTRVLHVRGPVQDVTNAEARVTVDSGHAGSVGHSGSAP